MGDNSDFDGEAYATDVAEAVTNSIFENDQRVVNEIQHEVATEEMYHRSEIEPIVVKTGGTITVELETPGANLRVELDENHPAVEDIEWADYRDTGSDEEADDVAPSISERLEQQR